MKLFFALFLLGSLSSAAELKSLPRGTKLTAVANISVAANMTEGKLGKYCSALVDPSRTARIISAGKVFKVKKVYQNPEDITAAALAEAQASMYDKISFKAKWRKSMKDHYQTKISTDDGDFKVLCSFNLSLEEFKKDISTYFDVTLAPEKPF